MFGSRLSQYRPFIGLLLFLAVWWLVPPVIKSLGRTGFYEFQAPFSTTASHLRDLQTYWSLRSQSRDELIEAGRDLARINSHYALSRQQIDSMQDEIGRLEALLELPTGYEHRYEIARVVHRDLNAWWQQITIRKGRDYGIPEGAAVVFAGGVVGRIREVHANTATVELISSPGFRMAANLEGESRPVTYQGLPNPPFVQPYGEVLNIPPDIRMDPGTPRRLVSSRLGGIFPEGLNIGIITELSPGSDGYFQRGRVQLDHDLTRLREVAVIVPMNPPQRED